MNLEETRTSTLCYIKIYYLMNRLSVHSKCRPNLLTGLESYPTTYLIDRHQKLLLG